MERCPKVYNKLVEMEKDLKKQRQQYDQFEKPLKMASEIGIHLGFSLEEILKHIKVQESKMEEIKSREDFDFSDESRQSESEEDQNDRDPRNRIKSSGIQQMDGSLIIQEQKKNRFENISPIKQ